MRLALPAIISNVRFSADRRDSARLRSSISVFVPYHRTTFALAVGYWYGTKQEPPILPIKTSETGLFLTRLPGSEDALPGVHQLPQIFGMNGDFPPPTERLFQGETRIVKPSLVQKFGGAIWSTGPCQRGDLVDHILKLIC